MYTRRQRQLREMQAANVAVCLRLGIFTGHGSFLAKLPFECQLTMGRETLETCLAWHHQWMGFVCLCDTLVTGSVR